MNESRRCAGPGVSPDYDELNEGVQHEPSNAFDPDTVRHFASIGIKKGKPFAPCDPRVTFLLYDAISPAKT